MTWIIVGFILIVISNIIIWLLKCYGIIIRLIDTKCEMTYTELRNSTRNFMGAKTLDICLDCLVETNKIVFKFYPSENCYKYSLHKNELEKKMRRTMKND